MVFRASYGDNLLSGYQKEQISLNTRELLAKAMTGKLDSSKISTPVTMKSTTEGGISKNAGPVPQIDRSPKLSEEELVKKFSHKYLIRP